MEEAVNNIPKEQERWRKKDLKQHTSEVARDKVPHATAEREREICADWGPNDYVAERAECVFI